MKKTNNETKSETNGDEMENVAQKQSKGTMFKQYFTARRIAYIATFTALSFALRFLQFPILPAVPFLKFDFSDAFILICAYALGPVAGIIAGVMKEVIYGIAFTGSAFVGEIANIIILIPFILIPSIIYKKHKGIKSVLLWLAVACIVRTVWSIPVNMFLNFPAFMGFNWDLGMSMFLKVWHWATLFNLIKNIILAVVVMLLYKAVSRFIYLINNKFDKDKEMNVENVNLLDFHIVGLENGDKFPIEYTGRGQDISPEICISNLSSNAKTIAVTLEDTTHPIKDFTHWCIWNIPATNKIEKNIPKGKIVSSLGNAIQGFAYGLHRYAGPKPPKGKKHIYRFTVYALDCIIELGANKRKKTFLKKAKNHILQKGCIVGEFE